MARSSTRRDLFIQVSGNIDPLKATMKAGRSVLAEFGTAAIDTTAEVQKAFQNLAGNAPAQARAMEQAYDRTFATIRANAQAALNAPSGTGAVEVLNAAAARQSAEAAETKAAALRLVADAAQRAASATDGDSAANRVFAVAAEAAAQGAREEADALRAQAGVLNTIEGELISATGAQNRFDQSQRKVTAATAQQRAGLQQLSFQVGDVATQYAAGTPVSIIFAQQISQVTQAVSLMSDGTSGFLGLMSKWGPLIGAAAVVLTPFVAKLFEEGDAAKEAKEATEDHTKAVEAQRNALEKAVQTAGDKLKADYAFAEAERLKAIRVRETTAAMLEQAKVGLENLSAPGISSERGIGAAQGAARDRIVRLEAALAANAAELAKAETAATRAAALMVKGIVDANSTPEGRIRRKYEEAAGDALREVEKSKDFSKYNLTLQRLNTARETELKALQDQQRAARSAGSGKLTPSAVGGLLTGEFGGSFSGTRSATRNAEVGGSKRSYHLTGQAVDFVPAGGVKSISKDQIRAVLEAQGVSIKELLGPGDKGHSDHFHVAFNKTPRDAEQIAGRQAAAGRRAEAARQRELAEDISFTNEEKQLRHRLLDLQARTATNEEERNKLLEADIEAEAAAYATKIGLVKSAGKLDDKEAERLLQLNEEVRQQRLRNIKIENAARVFDRQIEAQGRSLDYDIQLLRLQLDLATTTAERKRIADELLAAEQKQRRLALEAIRDNPRSSADQIAQAQADLGRLPTIEAAERAQEKERNLSPLDEYRKRLEQSVGNINENLESIAVRGLEELESDLAGATTKALGLKGALGDIVEELIRIELRKAALAASGGENGGFLGGLVAGIGKLFGGGRAKGGGIDADKFYLVGEEGPELFAPGMSGTVIPNHVLASAAVPAIPQNVSVARTTTNNIHVHAKDAIMGRHILGWIEEGMSAAATKGAMGGAALGQKKMAQHQSQKLGRSW